MQHTLKFFDIPISETQVWETLNDEQSREVIVVLARLISKAIRNHPKPEEGHDGSH